MNRFDTLVQDTVELGDQQYLQKTKNTKQQTYGLQYRQESRYSEPVTLTQGIQHEEDVDILIEDAEQNGFKQLRQRLQP